MCDECQGTRCGGKFAPFFCANVTCLQYYCEYCWASIHSRAGREFHKPLVKEGGDRPRHVPFRWSWAQGRPTHKYWSRKPRGERTGTASGRTVFWKSVHLFSIFKEEMGLFIIFLLFFTVILLNSVSSIMQNWRVSNGTGLHFDSHLCLLCTLISSTWFVPWQYGDCHSHQQPSGWCLCDHFCLLCCSSDSFWTGACTYFQKLQWVAPRRRLTKGNAE